MFKVFADGTSNLPKEQAENVTMVPCHYTVDGEERIYDGNLENFDFHEFYEGLKNGRTVKTPSRPV